jgi:quinol monooxygenase YgiN
MARLFIRHTVSDYDAWRKFYDDFDEERRGMGVHEHAVYRSINDPNDVTVWHDFGSVEAAKAFASSDRLREAMEEAGMVGEPGIWIVEEA